MARPQILVIRGGAIGDFILTLPVFQALREAFPQAPLSVLSYPRVLGLALESGHVQEARSIDARPLASFFARDGELDEELELYFARFGLIISYLYDPDEVFRENIRRCSQAQFIPAPHRPDENLGRHAAELLLQPLERLAIYEADPVPSLNLELRPGDHLNFTRDALRVAIHPGSGSEKKNWPKASWRSLVQRLSAETDVNLLIAAGEAEGASLEEIIHAVPAERCQVARNWRLPELARALAQCQLFVGHDSGISHLAAAVRVPLLLLWGDTRYEVWHPLGAPIEVIRGGHLLAALPVETVYRKIVGLVSTA